MIERALSSNGKPEPASPLELLADLEQSTPEAVKKMRSHTRLSVRVKVIVRPGNVSDRLSLKLQGITGDISAGGCQVLTPTPLLVGDIYYISFDDSAVRVPPQYARCMRCRVIRDDAYESGFAFFTPVDLAASHIQTARADGII